MATKVNYYTFSNTSTVNRPTGLLQDVDAVNPIFNFDSKFLPGMLGISPLELGQSIPYISLSTIDLEGEIIENLNINYFTKGIDFSQLNQSLRYKDRPLLSLRDLEIKIDEASGYLMYNNVRMRFKIHSPDALSSNTLIALMIPNMPLLLEYGWNSPNEFLNQKERVYFQVVTYNLSVDESGQMEIAVEGKSMLEGFNNAYIGDLGDSIETKLVNDKEADGINAKKIKIQNASAFLRNLSHRKDQNSNDYSVLKDMGVSYKPVENIVREYVAKNFQQAKARLRGVNRGGKISFHDLVYTLCDGTFAALTTSWPKVDEFRVVYGDFNEDAVKGTKNPSSIADFPINWNKFNKLLEKNIPKGKVVINIKQLLEMVITSFIENEEYWKDTLRVNATWSKPEVFVDLRNRSIGPDRHVLELMIVDTKHGIPPTLKNLPDGVSSQEEAEARVLNASKYHLPIMRVGHANSFIKKIQMTPMTDASMKAVLIARMEENRTSSKRDTKVNSKGLKAKPVTPLILPLQGNLEALGHVQWKPFKFFYFSFGNFLLDGVYKITSMTHKISSDGFSTSLEIRYN